MKFHQHIPNFVSGVEPAEAEFSDEASLRAIPCVASWASNPKFSRFSRCNGERQDPYDYLMAEMTDGKFWVVGYVSPRGSIDFLPEWKKP